MNGEKVMENYRIVMQEMKLIASELQQPPELYGSTAAARAQERERWERHCDGLREQLEQLTAQASALKKPFETCVGRCRSATTRRVLRLYYGMGLTDAQASEYLGLQRNTACKYRRRFINELNKSREV